MLLVTEDVYKRQYIVTPSRDKEPVFEVTGLPDSVEAARREIEAHIAVRTGATTLPDSLFSENFLNSDSSSTMLASLYKSGLGSIFNYMDNLPSDNTLGFSSTLSGSSGCSSASSSSSNSGITGLGDLGSIWSTSLDRDEGIGESPSFETATASSSIWSFPSARPSPPHSTSPAESLTGKRECIMCGEREVTAALVPCGHNLFCMDCGENLCQGNDPTCPCLLYTSTTVNKTSAKCHVCENIYNLRTETRETTATIDQFRAQSVISLFRRSTVTQLSCHHGLPLTYGLSLIHI